MGISLYIGYWILTSILENREKIQYLEKQVTRLNRDVKYPE